MRDAVKELIVAETPCQKKTRLSCQYRKQKKAVTFQRPDEGADVVSQIIEDTVLLMVAS